MAPPISTDTLSGRPRRPARVLVNGLAAKRGGVGTYLTNLIRYLPEDAPVKVFVLPPPGYAAPEDRPNLTYLRPHWSTGNPFARAAWEALFLPKIVQEIGADVLFCPGGMSAPVHRDCRTILVLQNLLPFDRKQRSTFPPGYMRFRHWALEKALLNSMRTADGIIYISEFGREMIEDFTGRKYPNSVVIPHGINAEFRDKRPVSDLPDWAKDRPYLLYVSDLHVYKSQIEVVRAYAQLRRERPTMEKLIFVGDELSTYGRNVQREIDSLGLSGDVLIAGKVHYSKMPALYQHATINIFASQCENCPNILLEALASGRPVLCSDRPPMSEFAGQSVQYFDPTSSSDLAEKLADVLSNGDLMHELSRRAVTQSENFDWQRSAARTWQFIAEIGLAHLASEPAASGSGLAVRAGEKCRIET